MSSGYHSGYNPNPNLRNPYEPNNYGQPQANQPNAFLGDAIGLIQNPMVQQFGRNMINQHIPPQFQQFSFANYIFTQNLRSYFNIDNQYVLKKILKIIFPFTKSDSYSESYEYSHPSVGMTTSEGEHYQKRRLLTPDLYIPLMSFMTFILMICLLRGVGEEFNPDLIGKYTINCLVFAFLEVLLYKLVLIIGKVATLSFLDLIAFLNYKFVGLCFILIIDLLFGGLASWIVSLYFSVSFVYYMYAELQVHAAGIALGNELGLRNLKSSTVLYILSGLQFLTMWILIMTTTDSK